MKVTNENKSDLEKGFICPKCGGGTSTYRHLYSKCWCIECGFVLHEEGDTKPYDYRLYKEVQWPHGYTLTNTEAEVAYKTGDLPSYIKFRHPVEKRVSFGFYSEELSFEEWLKRYNINIA